ncbi:alpha/beta fold hydrolase [Acetobacter lambici]|uniref:Alpha/beta fold hydrolase n=1 Tax=Acetobacter lambici TaxID=1332824 RepID=A0ABT1EYM2_9PROT|nr:alpha/beta fold hydrolase [Acetobacter lambici]MCP1258040.1 alpha/beta fold hydrolase [Acetobacter lambici]NHO56661.1 alpha/beta fold hydrolase [Acetobacter lambici]
MLLNVSERGPEHPTPAPALPVVLLHGLFGRARNLGFVQRKLATTRRTLAMDLRNHGDSPHGPMSYPAMAGDVLDTMEQNHANPAIVLGHSMGGKTAMTLALTHPNAVRALIVVDIAPAQGGFDRLDLPDNLDRLQFPPHLDLRTTNDLLRPYIASDAVRQLMAQNIRQGDNPGWAIGLKEILAAMPDIMGWPQLAPGLRYEGPTLFIRGETSPYISPDNYPTMQALFPNHRLESIRGAGHWVHADAPRRFTELVEEFLAGIP